MGRVWRKVGQTKRDKPPTLEMGIGCLDGPKRQAHVQVRRNGTMVVVTIQTEGARGVRLVLPPHFAIKVGAELVDKGVYES